MAIAELKRNAVKMLDGINDELFWSQLCAYLALYTQWKNSGSKDHAPDFGALFNTGKNNSNVSSQTEKNVKEMTDKEFLDFFCALPDHNPMTAEDEKKLITENRISGVTRNINYQAFYDAKISD